jgi:hypothetical protein
MGKYYDTKISNNPDIRYAGGGQVYSKEYINKRIEWVLKMYRNLDEEEYSEIENNLYNFSNQDFPVGLYNLPKQIKLYRIIYLKSEKDFNKDDLGVHFIADKRLINDDFLWSIGITKKEYKKLYLISINVDSKYINIDWTLSYKARYPNEFEFTLKDNSKYEIESIEKYNPDIRFNEGGQLKKISAGFYRGVYKGVEYEIINIPEQKVWYWLVGDEGGDDWYNYKKTAIAEVKSFIDDNNPDIRFNGGGQVLSYNEVLKKQQTGDYYFDFLFSNENSKFIEETIDIRELRELNGFSDDEDEIEQTISYFNDNGMDEDYEIGRKLMNKIVNGTELNPIVVDEEYKLLDGRHRLSAYSELYYYFGYDYPFDGKLKIYKRISN